MPGCLRCSQQAEKLKGILRFVPDGSKSVDTVCGKAVQNGDD
jgi:hypothetical protein